jgi:DNA-binding transcriptional ArsR family regulator
VNDEHWYEDETGSMVRPYTVTRGRTRPSDRHAIDLMSRVTALETDAVAPGLDHAGATLLDLVRRGPRPVVELAADADLPLTVVRVLLDDLAEAGLVRIDRPRRAPVSGPAADPELLREIVHRLKQL